MFKKKLFIFQYLINTQCRRLFVLYRMFRVKMCLIIHYIIISYHFYVIAHRIVILYVISEIAIHRRPPSIRNPNIIDCSQQHFLSFSLHALN